MAERAKRRAVRPRYAMRARMMTRRKSISGVTRRKVCSEQIVIKTQGGGSWGDFSVDQPFS
jgi:hypothetical protein